MRVMAYITMLFSGSVKKTLPRQANLLISSSELNESSTASALAALYSPTPSIDPNIPHRREKSGSSLTLQPKDKQSLKRWQMSNLPKIDFSNNKWKGKTDQLVPEDSSRNNISGFSASPSDHLGAKSISNTTKAVIDLTASAPRVSPGSSRPSLMKQTLFKAPHKKDGMLYWLSNVYFFDDGRISEYGPLYINDRRQLARKTAKSSRPIKLYHLDRKCIFCSVIVR